MRISADADGYDELLWFTRGFCKNRGKRIAVLYARFDDLACQPLSYFDCFGHAASFRNQTRNIAAGRQVSPLFQRLNPQADRDLVYFCDVLLDLARSFAFNWHRVGVAEFYATG